MFCNDQMMAYDSCRRSFRPGDCIQFDDNYRVKHLPLVNPRHPFAGKGRYGATFPEYVNGLYSVAKVCLVAPIQHAALISSPAFIDVDNRMRSASFAGKLNWELGTQRANKVHATIIGDLTNLPLKSLILGVQSILQKVKPLRIRIAGPFMGQINTGRVYYPIYPQVNDGEDVFASIQVGAGISPTRLYVAGYYHFMEELTSEQTAELGDIIESTRHCCIADLAIEQLEIWKTDDDLALSANVVQAVF